MTDPTTRIVGAFALAAATMLTGCKSAYYNTWEALGWHKRDILVDRVEDAKTDQQNAKEQFADALEQFQSVVKVDGGELETKYNKLKTELDASEAAASAVTKRIASVESVAGDLFNEWEAELEQYSDPNLRRQSEGQLRETRSKYTKLIAAMKKAESKMEPVLKVFRDQVLFLKHNLNAKAVASLQGTVTELQDDVAALVRDMQASIDEAEAFIDTLK